MMKYNNLIYTNKEVLKMVYYVQDKSIWILLWEWLRLKYKFLIGYQKVTSEEIEKYVN